MTRKSVHRTVSYKSLQSQDHLPCEKKAEKLKTEVDIPETGCNKLCFSDSNDKEQLREEKVICILKVEPSLSQTPMEATVSNLELTLKVRSVVTKREMVQA